MKLEFQPAPKPSDVALSDWNDWTWQLRRSLKSENDFSGYFDLTENERAGFEGGKDLFQVRCTPYYASLAARSNPLDPIRKILMPTAAELHVGAQAMLDPLGEKRNNPAPRIIHRYPDRLLFLVTDTCSVYCRYCTRKHFTGQDEAFVRSSEYDQALSYIRSKPGLREVILSGGDPLTLSDTVLDRVLTDLRSIEHVEIIRIGSRMPVVCPMRVTDGLVNVIKKHHPVFMMTHFNHPRELTRESADALLKLVDAGVPTFNQLVLLNGVNNHPAVVQALSRRLMYLRVKPYYMFQCDPSEGTDHLRTSIEDSLEIQRELWGRMSGLAMPTLSVDIPDGGGKTTLVPDFEVARSSDRRTYVGWDGVRADYVNPPSHTIVKPIDAEMYYAEWEALKNAKDMKEVTP
ncbi:MAG: KamA family radical SAM protein [Bdellovibrionota bacterium]